MKDKRTSSANVLTFILIAVLLVSGCAVSQPANFAEIQPVAEMAQDAQASDAVAYVEPSLLANQIGPLSVIVTGNTPGLAAQAVTSVGGRITSDLRIIDAVGAKISAEQLMTLATFPGLVSIVENQEVTTSGGPVCDPSEYHDSGPCAGFGAASNSNGWVSDRQEKKAEVTFSDNIGSGVVSLADGGYVIVAEKNSVTFYNADGSVRARASNLPFEKMKSNPVVGLDGTVFFMGEKPGIASDKPSVYRIYAVDATGKDRWSYDSKDLVPGIALSPDGAYLYVAKVNVESLFWTRTTADGRMNCNPTPTNPAWSPCPRLWATTAPSIFRPAARSRTR